MIRSDLSWVFMAHYFTRKLNLSTYRFIWPLNVAKRLDDIYMH